MRTIIFHEFFEVQKNTIYLKWKCVCACVCVCVCVHAHVLIPLTALERMSTGDVEHQTHALTHTIPTNRQICQS